MKTSSRILCFSAFALAMAGFAKAESALENVVETTAYSDAQNPSGYWLFGGLNSGVLSSDVHDGIFDGSNSSARFSMSQYHPDRIYHVGVNLGFTKHTNDERLGSLSADFAYRFRRDREWSYGPEALVFIGSGDLWNSATGFLTPFVGGGIAREFTFRENIARVGARALMDISIRDSTNFMGQVYFEMGFGWEENRSSIANAEKLNFYAGRLKKAEERIHSLEEEKLLAQKSAEELAAKTSDAIVAKSSAIEKFPINTEVTYDLPSVETILFDLYDTKLSKEEELKIENLVQQLKKDRGHFRAVEVLGHSDKTGSIEVNKKLSLKRAQSVADAMKRHGWKGKVEVIGMGSSFPVNDQRIEPNRRVEIRLAGLKEEPAKKTETN